MPELEVPAPALIKNQKKKGRASNGRTANRSGVTSGKGNTSSGIVGVNININ